MVKSINKKPTDEKSEKNLRLLERFTLVRDDSGHRYVIPIGIKVEFDKWAVEEDTNDPNKFDDFRIEGGLLTFTDPKVN